MSYPPVSTTSLNALPAQKRRVFFSFHYGADMWRANQVRQSWRYKKEHEREAFGWFDASIWESSKRRGDDSVKELLRNGLKNTSVTCILAGTETYSRRWVRYEIAQSIVQGNGLLTVKIHRLKNEYSSTSREGPNPLEHVGVYRSDDGRLLLAETDDRGTWVGYSDYTRAVKLPAGWEQPSGRVVFPLSRYGRIYDSTFDDISKGLGDWVAVAAMEAGR